MGIPLVCRAESLNEIVRIGSPTEWTQYESYWKQLVDLMGDSGNSREGYSPPATNWKVLEQALIRNLRVSDLRLVPVYRRFKSSQVLGKITNNNARPVSVEGINIEIRDSFGNLIQTNTAVPEPSTILPGATVTFQKRLEALPANRSFEVQLMRNNPFAIRNRL
ncbi:MAG: hypothetical protein WCD18_06885 [Thermosynechococcaceae cyanobacterium]